MLRKLTLLIFLLPITANVHAVKIYECEDEQGQKTFEAHCPPGTIQLQLKPITKGNILQSLQPYLLFPFAPPVML